MSGYGWPKNEKGEVIVNDQTVADALEVLINQIMLLNERFEEAFETGIKEQEITHDVN